MKIRLTPSILRLAYRFIDVESLGESSVLDGRTIEYGFALSKLARLPVGKLLDVGCVSRINPVVSTMCELGWKVYGIDIRDYKYSHPNFWFIKGDITKQLLRDDFFDAITVISTLEHIGVKGRYGIEEEDTLALYKAIANMKKLLKLGGTLIVTLSSEEQSRASMINSLFGGVRNMRVQNGVILLDLIKE